jgi:hypothetical protein
MGDIVDLQFVKDKKREEQLSENTELDKCRHRLLQLYDNLEYIVKEINHIKNVIRLLDNDNKK